VLDIRQALAPQHPDRWFHEPCAAVFSAHDASELTMKKSSLVIALATGLLVAGCATRNVRIAELKDDPSKYDDKSVRVRGVVTTSWGVPLVPFQFYNVDDGTGQISVVSRSGRSPVKGSRVEVKGKVGEVAVFGGRSVGLHLQEEDRDIDD
jgi:hypothetical protein